MLVTYHGHACFSLESDQGRVIIDPFLSGNPQADITPDQVKVDAVLVTHGHGDHLGDAITIAKDNDVPIIATAELAAYCARQGVKTHPMHIGGSKQFPFAWVKLTQAWHGSAVYEGSETVYTGTPCGFLVQMDGKMVYHSGDTGLFSDMRLLGERHPMDLALLPIGDNFVMGVADAVYAASLLKAKTVVPMHFNTFDLIKQDPEEFAAKAKAYSKPVILKPGQQLTI